MTKEGLTAWSKAVTKDYYSHRYHPDEKGYLWCIENAEKGDAIASELIKLYTIFRLESS